jgi:hypothetical protein
MSRMSELDMDRQIIASLEPDDDIACMSRPLGINAKQLYEIWMRQPARRHEFGETEIRDLREALVHIAAVLKSMEKASRRAA